MTQIIIGTQGAPARAPVRRLLGVMAAVLLMPAAALAGPIDLRQLFHEDNAPILIAGDGSSAIFSENPSVDIVFLSNVPGFGDPTLVTPATDLKLLFDYSFDEAPNSADLFHFALLDGDSGDALTSAFFNLFVTNSGAGSAAFDLSSLVGSNLGFQFELVPDFSAEFDSTLTISNLRLEASSSEPPISIAEPSVLALLLVGGMMLRLRSLRKPRTPFSLA